MAGLFFNQFDHRFWNEYNHRINQFSNQLELFILILSGATPQDSRTSLRYSRLAHYLTLPFPTKLRLLAGFVISSTISNFIFCRLYVFYSKTAEF